MVTTHRSLPFLVLVLACCGASLAVGSDTEKDKSISNGLRYLAESGEAWKEKRGCVSCHQIPPMLWAMNLAQKYTLSNTPPSDIDTPDDRTDDGSLSESVPPSVAPPSMSVAEWNEWSVNVVNFVKPAQKATCNIEETMTGNIDTMAGLLLASAFSDDTEWKQRFTNHLIAQQAEDGSWNPCGQLPAQRRNPSETKLATTLWVALALESQTSNYKREKVNQLLSTSSPAETTELLALQLLLAKQLSAVDAEATLRNLIERQNKDGGWGWKLGEPSDALGTGFALYALRSIKPNSIPIPLQETITQAERYLIANQQPDGGWLVPGTKASAKGKQTATANDWGSAWAVIALLSLGT